jgi:hypothetical protein
LAFVEKHPAANFELRYEQLVTDTEPWMRRVTDFLELPPLASVSLPANDSLTQARLGDKTGIHKFQSVSAAPTEEWRNAFNSPLRKFWARRYLEFLGRDRLARMGYGADDLIASVNAAVNSTEQFAGDLVTLGWKLFRAFEQPPFYRTKMKTRDERRGLG